MTRVVVCCGSGGVGKTTTAAALSLALAGRGLRVAVLTIDPAKRLADSLGIGPLGNAPQRVPVDGHLEAMMLDMKATWDGVVERFAPSPAEARRILDNRYYRFASTRLAGSHEYMAMERLYELYECGEYDIVLLDTPPSRHAVEFLRAPGRIAGLFDDSVMTWLSMPKNRRGFRALEKGSEMIASVLKRLVGRGTIEEIAEFFDAMQGLWDALSERGRNVEQLLASDACSFLLVTTAAPAASAEARDFRVLLRDSGMPLHGLLINRVQPRPASRQRIDPSAFPPRPDDVSENDWRAITAGVADARARQWALAEAERPALDALSSEGVPTWEIPELTRDVHDLAALSEVASHLTALAAELGQPPATS